MRSPADRGSAVWNSVWDGTGPPAEWDNLSEEVWQFLSQALPPMPGLAILEAGCGTGRVSARMSGAGAEVALIDFSPAALALARGFFATAGRAARVVQGDIERLPFASGSFDAVFSAGVLEHFAKPNRLEVLCDMARVLRPGGTLVTLVPNARALLYRAAKRRAERTGQWCWGYEQSLYTLRPEYERAGLRWIREGCLAVSQELSFVRQFITQRPSVLWALDQVLFRVLRPLRCAGYLRGAVGVKK